VKHTSAAAAVTIGNNVRRIHSLLSLPAVVLSYVELTAVCWKLYSPVALFAFLLDTAQRGIFRRRQRPDSGRRAPGCPSERRQSAVISGCLFHHRSCRQFSTASCNLFLSGVLCFCSEQKMLNVDVRIAVRQLFAALYRLAPLNYFVYRIFITNYLRVQ